MSDLKFSTVKLSDYTTIKLGGYSDKFVECTTDKDISDAIAYASEHKLSFHVLGGGSNTVFSDKGYDGIIIYVNTKGIEKSGDHFSVKAGERWDDFVKYAKNRNSPGAERAIVVETRRIGRGAVQEVIGKGALDKLMGDLQLSREVRQMDEVLKRISQEGVVTYGRKEVADAIGFGAVEQVLIADTLLRDPEIMALIEAAEAMRANIVVLSSSFEPGERLVALGGIAALLRYKI